MGPLRLGLGAAGPVHAHCLPPAGEPHAGPFNT